MKKKLLGICLLSTLPIGCGEIDVEDDVEVSPALKSAAPEVGEVQSALTIGNDGQLTVFPGQGRSSITQAWKEQCVRSPQLLSSANNSTFTSLDFAMSSQQLYEQLSYSFSGKAQFGLFGATARTQFAKTVQSSQRSINLVFSSRSTTDTSVLDLGRLTWNVPKTDSRFMSRCGDTYLHETRRGAELFLMMKMDFASQAEKTAFEAAFGASYLTAGVEGALQKISQSFNERARLSVRAFQRGGDSIKLNQIVGGSNGEAAVSCVLNQAGACETFMAKALSYAGGTKSTDFPQNAKALPADIDFVLRDWSALNAGASVQPVPTGVQWVRAAHAARLQTQIDIQNRFTALGQAGYFGAPDLWRLRAGMYNTDAQKNIEYLRFAFAKCYDELGTPPTQAQVDACIATNDPSVMAFLGFKDLSLWISEMDYPLPRTQLAGNGPSNVRVTRSDFVQSVSPGAGHFGTWTDWALCPVGTHAIGYAQKVETCTSCDDTALNSIELACSNWNRSASVKTVRPHEGFWGDWHPRATCTRGPIAGMTLFVEPYLGEGQDDTGANKVTAECVSAQDLEAVGGAPWGVPSTETPKLCPSGTAVCGARIRIESDQRQGDDTAMNGIDLACCAY